MSGPAKSEPNQLNTLQLAISQRVLELQGCKITELLSDNEIIKLVYKHTPARVLIEEANNHKTEKTINIVEVINAMVEKGELVAIEYVLPNMTYKIKTYLFPKGTQFTSDTLARFFDTI
ncbi:MAG: hypothetical protein HC836_23175 [Richelia sp. RM2_1_2]|nr:hypothetical protein [Richelia sp. RM2_1_2]